MKFFSRVIKSTAFGFAVGFVGFFINLMTDGQYIHTQDFSSLEEDLTLKMSHTGLTGFILGLGIAITGNLIDECRYLNDQDRDAEDYDENLEDHIL